MNTDFKNIQAPVSTITYNKKNIEAPTGNIYQAIFIIARRATQINTQIKSELRQKLDEFSTINDSTEEIFENREQIETSKYYEMLPKATSMALSEWLNDEIQYKTID